MGLGPALRCHLCAWLGLVTLPSDIVAYRSLTSEGSSMSLFCAGCGSRALSWWGGFAWLRCCHALVPRTLCGQRGH